MSSQSGGPGRHRWWLVGEADGKIAGGDRIVQADREEQARAFDLGHILDGDGGRIVVGDGAGAGIGGGDQIGVAEALKATVKVSSPSTMVSSRVVTVNCCVSPAVPAEIEGRVL